MTVTTEGWDGNSWSMSGQFSDPDGETIVLSLMIDGASVGSITVSGNMWSTPAIDFSVWTEGSHIVEVQACDESGLCSSQQRSVDNTHLFVDPEPEPEPPKDNSSVLPSMGLAGRFLRHLPHSYTRADATEFVSFSGTVDRESHEGGLLVSLRDVPRLGATLRIIGGKPIGKVNSVIGAIDGAFVHIHPITDQIEVTSTIGSPVEIAPREKREYRGRGRDSYSKEILAVMGDVVEIMTEKAEIGLVLSVTILILPFERSVIAVKQIGLEMEEGN